MSTHSFTSGCSLLLCLTACMGCGGGKAPYEGKSVAALQKMLSSTDPEVQIQGAFGLSRLGAAAQPALPTLAQALQGPDARVRQNAALALGQVGSPDAVGPLTQALADPEWTVRRQAAVALGEIGWPARAAIPWLAALQNDPEHLVGKAARQALARIQGNP